ncbi:hypothetical protein [uncultured Desulfobulbus sp.]|uniref:hypothetical protein n=1 Tax=uncultured Desulfobulbus sp. TaxID=239745 RepID=UPI0029C82189|nr:hypothetical protein [uncultured Desulfobulbus sp.]
MYPKLEKQANSSCPSPKAETGRSCSFVDEVYIVSTFSLSARADPAFEQKAGKNSRSRTVHYCRRHATLP